MDEMKMIARSLGFGLMTLVFAVGGFIVAALAFNSSKSFLVGLLVLALAGGAWFYFTLLPYLGRGQEYARETRDRQMETYMDLGAEDRRRQQEIARRKRH